MDTLFNNTPKVPRNTQYAMSDEGVALKWIIDNDLLNTLHSK